MSESGIGKHPSTTHSCSSRTDIRGTRSPSPRTTPGKLRMHWWKSLLSVVTVARPSRPSLPQRKEELPPQLRPLILRERATLKGTAPLELPSNPYLEGSFASKRRTKALAIASLWLLSIRRCDCALCASEAQSRRWQETSQKPVPRRSS